MAKTESSFSCRDALKALGFLLGCLVILVYVVFGIEQVAADSTGFVNRGGLIVRTLPAGYNPIFKKWERVVHIKTGLAVDRYVCRVRLADGTWWEFTTEFRNRWYPNATSKEKIDTFVNWYSHNNSGTRLSRLVNNPDDSFEVEMLRAPLETYVPCVLGAYTIIDIVDPSSGALFSAANTLLDLLADQPIQILSVRIIPATVEGKHSDGVLSRSASWFWVRWYGKATVEVRSKCLQHLRKLKALSVAVGK